jgi:hypothetical protein
LGANTTSQADGKTNVTFNKFVQWPPIQNVIKLIQQLAWQWKCLSLFLGNIIPLCKAINSQIHKKHNTLQVQIYSIQLHVLLNHFDQHHTEEKCKYKRKIAIETCSRMEKISASSKLLLKHIVGWNNQWLLCRVFLLYLNLSLPDDDQSNLPKHVEGWKVQSAKVIALCFCVDLTVAWLVTLFN